MPKSDFLKIQADLSVLWKFSEKISNILSSEENLSLDELDELNNIYEKRSLVLSDIDNWRKSDIGIEIISKNFEIWNKVIKKIADIDIENLKRLESNVKIAEIKLKDINKQKSLLLYNRDNLKWILNQ